MSPKRILIFSPYANWLVHMQVDAVLGLALQMRGAEVRFLSCENLYEHCPAVKGRHDCDTCRRSASVILNGFFISSDPLNRYMRGEDEAQASAWIDGIEPSHYAEACFDDLPVGNWALSSTLTQLRSTLEDLVREPAASIYRRYIIDTLKTYWAVSRAIEEFRPDHALLFNGRLYPYRAAVEAFRRHDIPFVIHERGFAPRSFLFLENRSIINFSVYRQAFQEWKNVALEKPTLEYLAALFDGRKTGKTINQYPFHSFTERGGDIRERLGIPPGKRIVGVFTSSFDELYCCDDYDTIDDQVSMLEALFAYYRERDVYVVVRHHPYIGGLSYDIAERTMLCRYYRSALNAPPNVRIVMPKEKLISYELFPHLDYAIAPYSTIAFELALDGIPTAVYSRSYHAEAFPLTIDRTREGIIASCERAESEASLFDLAATRGPLRFANLQYLLFSWNFKSMGIREHFIPDLRISHTDELLPGRDPALDVICNHFLDGKPLHRHPTDEDRGRTDEAEDAFLTARFADLKALRATPAGPVKAAGTTPSVVALCLPQGHPDAAAIGRWGEHNIYPHLVRVILGPPAGPPGEVLRRSLEHPEAATSDCVLLHTDAIQYEERTIAYAAAALTENPERSCAAFGTWVAQNSAICGSLDPGRLSMILPKYPQEIWDAPWTVLSLMVWRREALARFAAEAVNDSPVEMTRRLTEIIASDNAHLFPEPLAMVWF